MRQVIRSIAILPLLAAILFGQAVSTSQISGTIQDASGLAIAAAEIKATQTDTGVVRSVASGADGSYVLANLPIGPYQVEVRKEGFTVHSRSGIVLQVNSSPTIDATLAVGSVNEQVSVEANASLVETRATGVGQVIDNQRVLELPLNGRQATDLVFLAGMATVGNGANLNSGVRNYPTVQISVAGGLDSGLTYLLDGGTHNDPYNNLNLPLPFPDAMQEFRVETSALPAQYGHHSAAAVNAVTKSGTNTFHGSAFEFLRNQALNARNTFAAKRDSLKRNQFGGTLGGPIIKNKLFFFVGEQTTTRRSTPSDNIAFIPTAAMIAGDFREATAPACNTNNRQITLGAPFVGNVVPQSLLSAPALALAKYLPLSTDPCGRTVYSSVLNSDEHIGVARTDYQIRDNHSLFGRYQLAWLDQPTDYDGKNPITLTQAGLNARVHSFVLGDTYVFGAGTVSNFRATLNRAKNPKVHPDLFDLKDIGVNAFIYSPKSMRASITNGFNVGGAFATDSIYNTTSFQFAEDVSLIRSSHQIGFGANYIQAHLNATSKLNAVGPVTFNGQITGLGLSDFLVGRPSAFQQSTPTSLYYRSHYVGLYLQDSWRLKQRLTVNYGVRWEPFIPESIKDSAINHFDRSQFTAGIRSKVYLRAPVGLSFPGDDGYPGRSVGFAKMANFAPRIGIAWDPTGDGSMSIRAAYGIFFNQPNLANYSGLAQIPPFGSNVTVANPASFADPWASQPGGNPFPVILSSNVTFPNNGQIVNFPLRPKPTYQNQWNLSIQKQIGKDWMVSSNYVGSSVIHLWGGGERNPGIYIPGNNCVINGTTFGTCSTTANLNSRRSLVLQNFAEGRFYGSVSEQDDGGTSNYNGLLLSVQRRRAKGLTVQANYTYSHCIGDLGNTSLGVAGTNYMIPGDRHSSRGNCSGADRRHLFNSSTVYETPQFSGRMMKLLASGWQVSGIVRFQSGNFFSITSGLDQALTGAPAQRANQVSTAVFPAQRSLNLWLNPAAFAQPALGTYGNLGIANIQGPSRFTFDTGVTRTFKIREAHSLQYRWEIFNLPNHVNPDNPTTALNSANFGRILGAGDPRIMQMALKYQF